MLTSGVRRAARHGGAKATAKVFVSSGPRATAAGGSRKRAAAALRAAASGIATARAQMKITFGDSFVSSTCASCDVRQRRDGGVAVSRRLRTRLEARCCQRVREGVARGEGRAGDAAQRQHDKAQPARAKVRAQTAQHGAARQRVGHTVQHLRQRVQLPRQRERLRWLSMQRVRNAPWRTRRLRTARLARARKSRAARCAGACCAGRWRAWRAMGR